MNPADRKVTVTVDAAQPREAPLLANLMELYIHDLSEIFAVDIGGDGKFGYPKLPLYWSEPQRFPFLIRSLGRVAGFVLVTRGSPATDDPDDFDVAEFFILRRLRRCGVGKRAAFQLWDDMPGRWVVRVSAANHTGLPFWQGAVSEYTAGTFTRDIKPGSPHAWNVFSFRTPAAGGPTLNHDGG